MAEELIVKSTSGDVIPRHPYKKPAIRAWIAYDFFNSFIIINGSLHFSSWITATQGVNSFWYGLSFVASTIILLCSLPHLGACIDRYRNGRQVLLVLSGFLAILAILITGLGHRSNVAVRIVGTLIAFGLINLVYQASLVAYNWLLTQLDGVTDARDIRSISGIGEAAGNLGSVVGAGLGIGAIAGVRYFGSTDPSIDIFMIFAIIFIAAFLWIDRIIQHGMKEQSHPTAELPLRVSVREAIVLLRGTSQIRTFFLAFVLFADGILTVQLYLPIYMTQGLGFTSSQAAGGFALALTAAAVGGYLFSRFSHQRDIRVIIVRLLVCWVITLLALGVARTLVPIWSLLVVAGLLFGLLWSACRAYVIVLTPPNALGRVLGFFSVFERAASIIGPLLWGAIMLLPVPPGTQYLAAFVLMSALVAAGGAVLLGEQ